MITPTQALLIVDHGSVRKEANDMLKKVKKILEKLQTNVFIEIAHMELAEPSIEQGIERCVSVGVQEIIVHPYMLSPGRHSIDDIPRMVAKCSEYYPSITFHVTRPLGIHENICKVIIERAGLNVG